MPDGEDGIDSLPGADEQPVCDTLRQKAVLQNAGVHEPPMMGVPYPFRIVQQVAVAFDNFFIIHPLPQQTGLVHAGSVDVDEFLKHQQKEHLENIEYRCSRY